MSLSTDEFLKQLEERGVLATDQSQTIQDAISLEELPNDLSGLVRELIRQGKLTQYQAEETRLGNVRSLVLGNYVLLEKIGAGGMGQVFKARHRVMDRIVAVKILPAAMTKDKAAIGRFQREVKAAAKISHPNIVTAHDADQADGVHFLVMEYVDGCDLSALVKRSGPLSVDRAVNFILQAAKGLEAAHRKGIVHRDIKPANLLLDSEGVVKILDMGLARIDHADDSGHDDLTNTGTIMGTVDYMAPEQALDTKTADARADIYALGCSLYYLLTGKPAFQGDTAMKKLLAHRDQPIPSLTATRPEVPAQLEAIFKKMLAKNVEDRYQTMSEVIAEISRCSGMQDSPLTVRDYIKLQTEPNSSPTITQQLPFEQTVLTMATEQPAPATEVIAPRADNKKWLLIGGGIVSVALVAIIVLFVNRDGARPKIDGPGIAQQSDSSIDSAAPLAFQKPGFDEWVNEVRAMPTEKQLEAVSKKLVELNPGFDGKFAGGGGSPVIQEGVVATFAIITDKVTDISPIRAFPKLYWLDVMGSSQPTGKLRDLSPLKGTKLTKLGCRNNLGLSDLSPLKDLPLTNLDCPSTGVTDLSQLSAFKLTFLNISGLNIADLSPLKGMPLEHLVAPGTKVADLSPLQGLRMQSLNLQNSPASDLSPLEGMPLTHLRTGSDVSDLSPLRGMKLTTLSFLGSVTDLSPLEGMPLTSLQGIATQVSDLSPLKGMKLTSLQFEGPVSSLTPLEGMPLEDLMIGSAKVSDLAPLRGMPLKYLSFVSTPVSDLSPLEALPLESLTLTDTNVSDLSPLRAMKLTYASVTPQNIATGMDVLRQMATIKTIGPRPTEMTSPEKFWQRYDAGEFNKPITDFNSPEFQQWVQDVRALPAERQVEAVRKKLIELNPGFDGKLTSGFWGGNSPRIENGAVTAVGCLTDNVTDLSPLRAFAAMTYLDLRATAHGRGKLRDLSPLKGMNLTDLMVGSNPGLSDLSPLKALPLTSLHCQSTAVSDLAPLAGLKLTVLDITNSKVRDLSPLKGMPLEALYLANVQVSDITPLQGMPLQRLRMTNVPANDLLSLKGMPLTELEAGIGVTDLAPLRGMKLTFLTFGGPVTDLAPLRGMKLTFLTFGAPVTDLSPLEGMPLTSLTFADTNVSDLSPLKGMNLKTLEIVVSPVADLSAVVGMPLTRFQCWTTKVTDLSPLKAMKLTSLILYNSPISDLSIIEGMPLEQLSLADTKVSDLSLLRGMKLKSVVLTPKNITTGMDALRQMASLESIGAANGDLKSPAEFWKRYDAGEFAKPITDFNSPEFQQWVQEVRALPPEKQSQAVSKKLIELNPGFDGKLTGGGGSMHIHEGVVKTLGFFTDNVTDISPVRVFRELECLDLRGSTLGRGKLRDLSPLKGMRVPNLICNSNPQLTDLSPLKDSLVTNLDCSFTGVADLSPISGLKLTRLDVTLTKVVDLTPLKGMPLQILIFQTTGISDITPLRGLPLQLLVMDNSPVRDLSPLQGMPLTTLQTGSETTDLKPLQGMKLKMLQITGVVGDLSPLQGMPLTSLSFSSPNVTDLSPLKGMTLTSLTIIGPVSNVSALEGMPLELLEVVHSKVSDLVPLRGMKLKHLSVSGSPVTDLSVVEGMPLEFLLMVDTKVSDLSPLRDLKLTWITFTPKNITKGMDIIREMPSINTIGIAHWEMKSPAEFWKKYDAGDFAGPITNFNSPEFQQWVQEVRALPAEKQLEAVSKKLVELNPGFDGTLTGGDGSVPIQNGVVASLGVVTDNVTDLSPIRVFPNLDVLSVMGSAVGKGKLRDLSPLSGMRLNQLYCRSNPALSDLSPLKDTRLTYLDCSYSKVSDLSPISALKLLNLHASQTDVMDLAPLKGMPLEHLIIQNTKVTDLTPLKGMLLQRLLCDNAPVTDLTALKGMPLTTLHTGVGVTDLSPLRGMQLTTLVVNGPVTDLAPLEGMPLTYLQCINTQVSSLSPLKGMKLTTLITNGPVTDVSALAGMPLETLELFDAKASDFSPLRGMKLRHLNLRSAPFADLTFVEEMPVEYLVISETKVSDLTPLRGTKLTGLVFTPHNITMGIDILRQLPSLKAIGIVTWDPKPTAEFWRMYDAGDFAKPQPQ